MKITKRQLRRIIQEETATIDDDTIKATVMSVLGDEGGAAGLEPIEDALEDLEDKDIELPKKSIEDIVDDVEGVGQHKAGDYIDTTQIKEVIEAVIRETYNSMSPRGRALANSIKGKFMRMYPDAMVGIDGRGGFITVNGVKAIDMSQATGRGMTDEEMIEKMHAAYAETHVDNDVGTEARRGKRPGEIKLDFGKDTYNYIDEGNIKITKGQLRKIIKESILNEFFGSKKYDPSDYHQAFLDAGYTERNIRGAVPNLAKSLAGKKVNPKHVVKAIKKLLQSPKNHIAGIPGSKAIYKELRKMGAVK